MLKPGSPRLSVNSGTRNSKTSTRGRRGSKSPRPRKQSVTNVGKKRLSLTVQNSLFESSSLSDYDDSIDEESPSPDKLTTTGGNRQKNRFSHAIYEKSAKIFAYLEGQTTALELPQTFQNEYETGRAYSVAFSAKRYQLVLKDVLLDSYFYSSYSKFESSHHDKVIVLLIDYYEHGFRFSDTKRKHIVEDNETHSPIIAEIQQAIVSHQIKLCAAFARSRIRECALSLDGLLPSDVREAKTCGAKQPLYARVNTVRTTTDNVINQLQEEKFEFIEQCRLVELTGKMFTRDRQFEDILVFSRDCKDEIYSHSLTEDFQLIPQDKSKNIIVEIMKGSLIEIAAQKDKANSIKPDEIQSEGDDVLLTHSGSGSLESHLASFIHPVRTLFVCGCPRNLKETLQRRISLAGANNVELLDETFLNISHHDERLKKVKIIICSTPCSKSGVMNAVDHILQEGHTSAKLLSGKVDAGKLKAIVSEEAMVLKQAMKFSHVQSIVYYTSSCNSTENEILVMKVLKEHREDHSIRSPFEMASFLPDLVLKLKNEIEDSKGGSETGYNSTGEKYFKLRPSPSMNGCFIVFLKRQYIEPTAKEIVERTSKKTSKGRKGSAHGQRRKKESKKTIESSDTEIPEIQALTKRESTTKPFSLSYHERSTPERGKLPEIKKGDGIVKKRFETIF